MTSPQPGLHPASGNDRGSFLGALESVACSRMHFAQLVGALVNHRLALEPGPQIFDRMVVGRMGWQERNLDVTAQRVQIVAHEMAVVCPGSVPNPCSVGFCRMVRRKSSRWPSSSLAGRPRDGTARSASIPASLKSAFQVYAVCRAPPTSSEISATDLPFCSNRPARTRLFLASSIRFLTRPDISKQPVEDIRNEATDGCHELWKDQ